MIGDEEYRKLIEQHSDLTKMEIAISFIVSGFLVFCSALMLGLIVLGGIRLISQIHAKAEEPYYNRMMGDVFPALPGMPQFFVVVKSGNLIPNECFVFGHEDGRWAPHPVDGKCLRAWVKKHQRRGETARQTIDRTYRTRVMEAKR